MQTASPRQTNLQVLLANRPTAEPCREDFELSEAPIPEPGDNEALIRTIYLSIDPYMRGRIREAKSYAEPVAIGAVMVGGIVGEVMQARSERFKVGDIVEGRLGWQQYAVASADDLRLVDPALAPITTALGILGMPGQTAYFGLLEVGRPRPDETVVVSAASGAVGGVVGQIARLKGCRVVGIVGSQAKREYALNELGYEAVIDRTIDDVGTELSVTCPNGVDVYFDNVGGHILDLVLGHINLHARIAICGMISEYNLPTPELAVRPTRTLLMRRSCMQGLLVSDYADRADEALQQLGGWVRSGELKYREDIIEGLEEAPTALIRVLRGENFGKQLVKVGVDPT
jgi:NADPH-dependent curcumin reductase CurA